MKNGINYGHRMHKAMQHLLKELLEDVAAEGLPGEHHFFITFDTRHPGVDIADWLKERYPEEMTIVMQEWFADLAIMKDRFTVTLNFGNSPEPLVVPFDSIKTFVDPSVEFGLRFDNIKHGEAHEDDSEDDDLAFEDDEDEDASSKSGDAEIVSLDAFRKH
ncbi:MAG TPA: ClpXP protease specificity-enhancing factor SspB [Paracoccaceae bacterium]|nr:ClpXP protease specificity-enhancing factor SspB [Paracoccaceae bacterium]